MLRRAELLVVAVALVLFPACCRVGHAPPGGFSAAEYAARAEHSRKNAPLVRWAVTRLKSEYFALDPGIILEVWLFDGGDSYLRNHSALFGGVPRTPYGFYSPCDRALIMNIASGYGTLVHEIVHPFMEANFPDSPIWFNEGLASLYEQRRTRAGSARSRRSSTNPMSTRSGFSGKRSCSVSRSSLDDDERYFSPRAARSVLRCVP